MPIFIEVTSRNKTININISHIKEFFQTSGDPLKTTIIFIDRSEIYIDERAETFRLRLDKKIGSYNHAH